MKSRYQTARKWLIFWTLFIGIGAVAGAVCMLIEPSGSIMGMDAMLPYFQVLPFASVLFQNFTFSGIALLIVNGLTNLTAAVLLLKNRRAGASLGGIFGVTLMLWICIQFYIFPLNFMSTAYFIFGLRGLGVCTAGGFCRPAGSISPCWRKSQAPGGAGVTACIAGPCPLPRLPSI